MAELTKPESPSSVRVRGILHTQTHSQQLTEEGAHPAPQPYALPATFSTIAQNRS